ncbi:MAG: Crp/Fnr family transcriptional regulator [Sutterellaceae bacterium]|nr:Crp/Fnr family transcriptional regulator [Sutterellaceae bacterium]MDD7441647.1 Crp/Fnr family transcriptional regulator [Sutterellaceae bacterium]MDY2867969.1 Crp/Fnr family transcriptional regulator [Mesosutterella sp.]
MDHVYTSTPWVVPPDDPLLCDLFREKGRLVRFQSRRVVNFGEEPTAYLVSKGLVGTFAGGTGNFERLIVFFPAGTTVGAEKSLKGSYAIKPLIARTLLPTEVLALDAPLFKRELEENPALAIAAFRSFLRHDDAKIEGLLMNATLRVQERLALVIKMLFLALGLELNRFPKRLPKSVTVTELARFTYSDRSAVSRTLAGWADKGLVSEKNGAWLFDSRILEVLGENPEG